MKRRMNHYTAIALAIGLTIALSCEKDSDGDRVPQLPPSATFIPDFTEFSDGVPIKKSTDLVLTNFQQAALAVWYTNSLLTVGLVVPVQAYNLAVDQTPVRIDNNTWEWSNDFEVGSNAYQSVLSAVVVEDMVTWEMKISKADAFQDFIWFTGSCNILATEGTWTLYETPADPHALLEIGWNVDYEAEEVKTFDATYTIIYASHNYYESYINYGITDEDPDYDAYYNVYNNSNETEIYLYKVYYNTNTHEGKYQQFINDNLTYEGCWDEYFDDIACSSEI